jgi:hypothetical protein
MRRQRSEQNGKALFPGRGGAGLRQIGHFAVRVTGGM